MYSDNAPELIQAAYEKSWVHKRALPGISKNNGLVERMVRHIQEGTPKCFCHANNIQKKDGMSPWLRRFNMCDFEGMLIPFGGMADFVQIPAKEIHQIKYSPRTVSGIFLGYFLQPGGKWKGDYLCI
eukprot:5195017-Amphidinium_carterae.9